MDFDTVQEQLNAASNLDELLNILTEAKEALSEDDYWELDTSYLPVFGQEPRDTAGIFSWDDTRFLVCTPSTDKTWRLVKREDIA